MKKLGIFMADGCEEIEGLAVVDLVRRTGMIDITTISISDTKQVEGSHKITFFADALVSEVNFDELDGVILPGGMPGTLNLAANETVNAVIKKFSAEGKMVAAICAAPSVLGASGILEGRHAACYPGFEAQLTGAVCLEDAVVIDGHIITSRGMGTAIDFGLAIIWYLLDDETAEKVKKSIMYDIQWEVVSEEE